jgi:hypothetical protein
MDLFIRSNIFLEVVKLHVFRKKILGTLGEAIKWVILNHLVKELS